MDALLLGGFLRAQAGAERRDSYDDSSYAYPSSSSSPTPSPADDLKRQFGDWMRDVPLGWRIISSFLTFFAAYLSWTCNSKGGMSAPMKVLWAVLAGVFGLFYVVLYYVFRAGECGGY